jgi:hypothetical protein
VDRQKYFESAQQAWAQLGELEDRTVVPAPIPHRYVGSAARAVRAMLLGPCHIAQQFAEAERSADPELIAANDTHLAQVMLVIDRAFFQMIHTAVQMGLETVCETEGWSVQNSQARQLNGIIARLREKDQKGRFGDELKQLTRMRPKFPRFDDYLETVLKRKEMPEQFTGMARRYFIALSILRNKCSHTDVRLTDAERKRLRDGGFGAVISDDGELIAGPKLFPQVVDHVLHFFDAVCQSPNRADPPA